MQKKEKKGILGDHKRQGKKFIPPFLQVGEIKETSWAHKGIPEVVWIAILQDHLGFGRSVEYSIALTRAATDAFGMRWYGKVSSYVNIDEDQASKIRETLEEKAVLVDLQESLEPLLAMYPACPLKFLRTSQDRDTKTEEQLKVLKRIVYQLYDRDSRNSMLTQATALHLGGVAGFIQVNEGSGFEKLPEIEKYPNTETSLMVASLVRSTTNMLFNLPDEEHSDRWANYFWDRGFEISPCSFIGSNRDE